MRCFLAQVPALAQALLFTFVAVALLSGINAATARSGKTGLSYGNAIFRADKPNRNVLLDRAIYPTPVDIQDAIRKTITGLSGILLLSIASTGGALGRTYRFARGILDRQAPLRHHAVLAVLGKGHQEPESCVEIETSRRLCAVEAGIRQTGPLSQSILHDLRNPLAAISAAAEMLVNEDLPPAHIKRLSSNICSASGRIQALLQDLLNDCRREGNLATLSSLREVVMAACDSLSATAELNGTTLTIEIQREIELLLERSRMERAFVNLIGNAIEAMPAGGEVRISAELVPGSVVVHVDDSGPGFLPEIRSRIFEPFVTAGKRNGLGLGLAFTRQTIHAHGGEIWIDNNRVGGARLSLRLPRADISQKAAS